MIDRKAYIITLLTGETATIPDRWCAFTAVGVGGTCTITDTDGNSMVLADGASFSYGEPNASRGYASWTVLAGAGTVNIVYNT